LRIQQTSTDAKPLKIRNSEFTWGTRTYIMGIVNATPDSFSGDGVLDVVKACRQAVKMVEQGADIIDVGGESTRPGHTPIDVQTELGRVIPLLQQLRRRTEKPISIDTTKGTVLREALANGADILNSIAGITEELAVIVAEHKTPSVVMHNDQESFKQPDVVGRVLKYFEQAVNSLTKKGLPSNCIILDPGIGFAKTPDENLQLLAAISKMKSLGFPILIGTSRKSTIGKLLDNEVNERVNGTAATVALAIAQNVDIVRVHDVKVMKEVAQVSDAICRGWRPPNWRGE
jgi:dihydropteroate synthase